MLRRKGSCRFAIIYTTHVCIMGSQLRLGAFMCNKWKISAIWIGRLSKSHRELGGGHFHITILNKFSKTAKRRVCVTSHNVCIFIERDGSMTKLVEIQLKNFQLPPLGPQSQKFYFLSPQAYKYLGTDTEVNTNNFIEISSVPKKSFQ